MLRQRGAIWQRGNQGRIASKQLLCHRISTTKNTKATKNVLSFVAFVFFVVTMFDLLGVECPLATAHYRFACAIGVYAVDVDPVRANHVVDVDGAVVATRRCEFLVGLF